MSAATIYFSDAISTMCSNDDFLPGSAIWVGVFQVIGEKAITVARLNNWPTVFLSNKKVKFANLIATELNHSLRFSF